jgi:hypothetical protein
MRINGLSAGVLALAGSIFAPAFSEATSLRIVLVGHDGARRSAYRAGYDRGRDDGLREGQRDGRRHEAFSFWDETRYRRCGYQPSYGPRGEYAAGYRRGFEDGYARGYDASYRCDRHHEAGCRDPRCGRSYDRRHHHSDDDWASREERGRYGR